MPTSFQFRRGTTAQNNSFTGAAGELSVDTDKNTLRVHDNSTAGGTELMLADASNATNDPTITLTGAVTGSGTMTNLGSVSIATTATADPTLTLTGDASGSATFTNLGNATLTVTVADDSHNHITSNIDGLAEYISDTVGAMVTSNTESGISVTYDDTDNTLDFNVSDPTITLTGAVTGSGTITNLGDVSITTTATSDPTITLTGAVTGSGTMTNLGDVSITTTATADPTLTLSGDASGSATFTNLGNATLSVTVADDSHNHSSSTGAFTVGGDLTVSGGDITLSGTGRIQGIDTVTAGTDAANKTYVDSAISSLSSTTLTEGNSNVTVADSGTGTFTVTLDAATHTTFNSTGIVLATGTFQGTATSAQYADLAEKYIPDAEYGPGTVLMFGGDQEVTIANEYATHRVAGVVSTDPAYMMNSDLEGGVYIALAGRVPCNVFGTCEKGDLMVTSDTDGCAVAWTESFSPPYGSVIGKALENKDTGNVGTIEVVVGVR